MPTTSRTICTATLTSVARSARRRAGRADHQRRGREGGRHLGTRLPQRGSAVTLLAVVGMNPDPHVDLTADQLAEHQADLVLAVEGDEPGRLLGAQPVTGKADLVVQVP